MCAKPCKKNQRALQCDSCDRWAHAKCSHVTIREYNRLSTCEDIWLCSTCCILGFTDSFFSSSASSSGESLHSSNPQIDEATRYKEQIKSFYKYNMSIAHLNINSLFNKVDEVKHLLLDDGLFDILAISETKLDSTYNNTRLQHPDYRILRRDRKKGGGGLLVYLRNTLSAYRRQKLEPSDIESIVIDLKGVNGSRFLIMVCYRSPNKNKPVDFLPSLYSAAENLLNTRNELLIIGDLNFDRLDSGSSVPDNHLSEFCDRFCLSNTIKEPSCFTRRSEERRVGKECRSRWSPYH